MKLKIGKLENKELKKIVIDGISYQNPDVVVKADIGEDCAYLDYGKDYCVLSTDPITASSASIGKLAVNVACNDVAACGIKPFAILLALMLPDGSTHEDLKQIMDQASKQAADMGVEIAGGHTEVTAAVNMPIIVATAIGKAPKNKTLARGGVKPKDRVIVTKAIGLEGTSIMADDYPEKVEGILSKKEIEMAKDFAKLTGVVTEGVIAGEIGVSAMHDITEGGLLGALWEMCEVTKVGALIDEEKIPVTDITKKMCQGLDIDYKKLISSGSMMIILPPDKASTLISKLKEAGVEATDIGEIKEKDQGILINETGKPRKVDAPKSDELYKAIDG